MVGKVILVAVSRIRQYPTVLVADFLQGRTFEYQFADILMGTVGESVRAGIGNRHQTASRTVGVLDIVSAKVDLGRQVLPGIGDFRNPLVFILFQVAVVVVAVIRAGIPVVESARFVCRRGCIGHGRQLVAGVGVGQLVHLYDRTAIVAVSSQCGNIPVGTVAYMALVKVAVAIPGGSGQPLCNIERTNVYPSRRTCWIVPGNDRKVRARRQLALHRGHRQAGQGLLRRLCRLSPGRGRECGL